MRRALALACSVLSLAFGPTVALAHVHPAEPHLELHLDHGHFHEHAPGSDDRDGDAVQLDIPGARPFSSHACPTPGLVAVGPAVEPPSPPAKRPRHVREQPRDPPPGPPPRLRAPPA